MPTSSEQPATAQSGNLLNALPDCRQQEQFEQLFTGRNTRIERIISLGQTTPPDQWYDQDQDEWVLLIQGEARLQFENEPFERQLKAGDYLHIPAHARHRVTHTTPNEHTIWLAVFIGH